MEPTGIIGGVFGAFGAGYTVYTFLQARKERFSSLDSCNNGWRQFWDEWFSLSLMVGGILWNLEVFECDAQYKEIMKTMAKVTEDLRKTRVRLAKCKQIARVVSPERMSHWKMELEEGRSASLRVRLEDQDDSDGSETAVEEYSKSKPKKTSRRKSSKTSMALTKRDSKKRKRS